MKKITLGGGCFWCIESAYNEIKGVSTAVSGYMGGTMIDPTYKDICTGNTGHAEVIQIEYDPEVISLRQILDIFWTLHDPTTLNRQGNDVGTQYRSAIFYHEDADLNIINQSIELTAKELWSDPITTQIASAQVFYPAESYHQGYYKENTGQGYCAYIITPKMAKFRKNFSSLLKN